MALDSYLRNGARFYDLEAMSAIQTDQMKHQANSVHTLVLKILIRMTTERESDRDFLSPHALNSLLNRNFDLPKLLDIVSLYWPTAGEKSRQAISQMIERVCEANAKHDKQMEDLVSGVISLMHLMREKLFLNQMDVPSNHESRDPSAQLKTMSWTQFHQIVRTITDVFVSVACFMEAFPSAVLTFHEKSFESACINFYELVFPVLQQEFDRRLDEDADRSRFGRQVLIARSYAIHSLRLLILRSSLRPLLDPESVSPFICRSLHPSQQLNIHLPFCLSIYRLDLCVKPILFDSLLDVVTLILSNKYFARDYCAKYPLSVDMEQLRSSPSITRFSDVDDTRIHYLLRECISIEAAGNAGRSRTPHSSTFGAEDGVTAGASAGAAGVHNKRNRRTKKEKRAAPDAESDQTASDSAGGGIQEIELLSLISGVKDILPDFGEGFIESCLEKFAFSQELTLNALLTDDLPDELRAIDKNMSREEKKKRSVPIKDAAITVPDVITSRRNVFDGDEFDMHRNETIDLSRVHVGKKDRTVAEVTADPALRTRTLLMQQRILQEEEDEELALLAEMGITDPADLYVG